MHDGPIADASFLTTGGPAPTSEAETEPALSTGSAPAAPDPAVEQEKRPEQIRKRSGSAGPSGARKKRKDGIWPKCEHALEAARAGFRVFPMVRGDLGDMQLKGPAFAGYHKDATTDEDQIKQWWSQEQYNIGLLLEGTDVIVIDCDVKNGQKGLETWADIVKKYNLPSTTYYAISPSGGRHYYYRLPRGETLRGSSKQFAPGCELKGNATTGHRHITGAGSVIWGKPYEAVGTYSDIATIPQDTFERLRTLLASTPASGVMTTPPADVRFNSPVVLRAAGEIIASASVVAPGERNNAALKVAAELKDAGVLREAANVYMQSWNQNKTSNNPLDQSELTRVTDSGYATENPAGCKAPADAFDEFEKSKRRKRLALTPDEWDAAFEAIPYLIDKLLPRDATVCIYGESNVGKSFVALDAGMHVALGLSYRRRKTDQGLVFYVAAEGGRGMARRTYAWLKNHAIDKKPSEVPFALAPHRFDLLDRSEREALIEAIKEAQTRYNQPVKLIILDTLARLMLGDENSTQDMGRFVEAMDLLRETFPHATVAVVHHTGKDKSRGARGSNALKGAVDVELEVQAGTIVNHKERDEEKQPPEYFGIENVNLGLDANGQRVNAGVLIEKTRAEVEFATPTSEAEKNLTSENQAWMDGVRAVMTRALIDYVTAEWMASYWKTKTETARHRLRTLHKAGVLGRPAPGRYTILHGQAEPTRSAEADLENENEDATTRQDATNEGDLDRRNDRRNEGVNSGHSSAEKHTGEHRSLKNSIKIIPQIAQWLM